MRDKQSSSTFSHGVIAGQFLFQLVAWNKLDIRQARISDKRKQSAKKQLTEARGGVERLYDQLGAAARRSGDVALKAEVESTVGAWRETSRLVGGAASADQLSAGHQLRC